MAGIKRKLLHTTLRYYILFSLVILIASSPVFYLTTEWLYLRKSSKTLRLDKKEFYKYSLPNLKQTDIDIWNKMDWSIKIEKFRPEIKHDTIFNISIFDPVEKEYDPYRVLLTPILIEKQPFTLMIRLNIIESDDIIKSTIQVFLVIIVFLLSGLYFITRYLSFKIWKPFYISLSQIEQFEIDKNKLPQWLNTEVEEFWRLNQSINKLINRNLNIYISQREFIDNAAHELQTPLAVIQAKLDTLLQTNHITKEQAGIIEYINQAIARLNRLNKNLLILSKLDHDKFPENNLLLLNDVLLNHIDFYKIQANTNNININYNFIRTINIESNAVLMDILISNLLQNAVLNTPQNGIISISLDKNKMIFSNTGQSGPLDSSFIFRRFSKSAANNQGNGLGLAIVKKITELYNWQISYLWQNNCHVFEVEFGIEFNT